MTKIEATCPRCGAVECAASDFSLAICSYSPASYYRFTCPSCLDDVQKNATDKAVELLIAEGVTPTFWELPAELLEPHGGAPLTVDDLIDLHDELSRPDWYERLARVGR